MINDFLYFFPKESNAGTERELLDIFETNKRPVSYLVHDDFLFWPSGLLCWPFSYRSGGRDTS
jgi:hypothetical protein